MQNWHPTKEGSHERSVCWEKIQGVLLGLGKMWRDFDTFHGTLSRGGLHDKCNAPQPIGASPIGDRPPKGGQSVYDRKACISKNLPLVQSRDERDWPHSPRGLPKKGPHYPRGVWRLQKGRCPPMEEGQQLALPTLSQQPPARKPRARAVFYYFFSLPTPASFLFFRPLQSDGENQGGE